MEIVQHILENAISSSISGIISSVSVLGISRYLKNQKKNASFWMYGILICIASELLLQEQTQF